MTHEGWNLNIFIYSKRHIKKAVHVSFINIVNSIYIYFKFLIAY
jgi:hypothetical protein